MADRLTAEPGTLEFLGQLLEIAKESDYPMDKALATIIPKMMEKKSQENQQKPEQEIPNWLLDPTQENDADKMQRLVETATRVWEAWNDEHICFANCMCLLRETLLGMGVDVPTYEGVSNHRLYALQWGESRFLARRKRVAEAGNRLVWDSSEGEYLEVDRDGFLVR